MRLEKLTIQGFKSFADRLEFTFGRGITAIVGPNGSGKSNVVDAIRWVLGEQSLRTLRGERLEDIIFSGSNYRRPHGLAEVTLTFNNESGLLPVSYSEVTVTRRAYRSGNSEFLLNGVPCRLRDIHDLFADTGMGKEGYAFIGQGKVDEVLSLSPEQRRVFLEQAAGVWKWRRRKKETQDKLVRTEQDLLRLSDVCAELERQRGPLVEEARRAKEYLAKRERLKTLQIFVGLSEINQLQEKINAAQEKYIPLREQLQALTRKRVTLETNLETRREEVGRLEKLLDNLKARQDEWQEQLIVLDNQLAAVLTDSRERAVRKETAAAQNEELAARLAEIKKQQSQGKKEQDELVLLLSAKENEVADLTKKLQNLEQQRDEIQRQADKRREQTITLLSERSAGSNALRSLIREEQALAERQQRAQAAYSEARARAEAMSQRQGEEEQKIQWLKEELRVFEEKRLQLEEQLTTARKQEENMVQNRDLTWRRLERLKAELKGLEGVRQRHSSYGQGPRSVLSAGRVGIIGAVAQLLVVPSDYEIAIETALGAAQQFLVATDDRAAAATIDWLRQTGKGRATFLPLNTIQPQTPSRKEMELAGNDNIVGWASELVQYSAQLKVVAQNLLGRVLVARDLAAARRAAKASGFRLKVVTLAGDVVNVGGSLSGGSFRERRPSQLAEERRLRELAQEVTAEEETLAKQTEATDRTIERRKQLEEQMNQLLAAKAQRQDGLATAQSKRQEYIASYREMERTQTVWQQEEQALVARWQELMAEKEQRLEAKRQAEIKLEKWEALSAEELRNQQALAVQVEKVREALLTSRLELVALQERDKQLKARLGELDLTRAHLWQQKKEVADKLEEITNLDIAAQEKREELEADKAQISIQLTAVISEGQEVNKTLYGLRQGLKGREQELMILLKEEEEKRSRVHTEELNLGRLEAAYAAAKERLFESCGVPLDSPIPDLGLKLYQAKAEIQSLTSAINAFDEVNLRAPQALAELTERQQFLETQANDVRVAKESLLKLIADIDQTVSSYLLETFGQLRSNFRIIFRHLFQGGQGDLKLSGDDLSEAGLEIYAELPGKKMQPLTLLSGGERALTAIAFLFALLRCGSSSLCVLDEIDAPLDEINAERFLSYLEKIAQETQFVVVTHRKAAMARAQTLYGLSMAASGVSSLVSVDLTQAAG
ncbi:MAG: chromosome segregation protein SMC [bacterium]|jgi:chromosome segregation protein